MAQRGEWGEVRLGIEDERRAGEVDPDRPLRMLVIGDFSGRGWRKGPLAERAKPVAVDIDNFDAVLGWHKPFVDVAGIGLKFSTLDDFHPERLVAHPDLFLDLATDVSEAPAPAAAPPDDGGNLLDAIVGRTAEREEAVARGGLSGFIEEIVAPHRERKPGAEEVAREEERNAAESRRLRQVLHHPAFAAVESAWRGLDFLLRAVEPSSPVRFYILDASREEMLEDPEGLVGRIRRPANDGWGAIALLCEFGAGKRDVAALSRWAELASAERAPLLAGADGTLETEHPGEEWEEFRKRPVARYVGLAVTRMLMRLPYGRDTSPVEGREFEEMAGEGGAYAWGHPVWACLAMMGEGFVEYGWELRPRGNGRVSGRPVHVFQREGETEMQACAERVLDDDRIEELLEAGLMPLTASRGGDELWLVRWQSAGSPLSPLAGWW
ncbi:MAG: type VI secretion system contractile sheath large subunit [Bryobacteraceae bacterium]